MRLINTGVVVDDEEALVHESPDHIEHCHSIEVRQRRHHTLRGLEREPTRQDAHAAECDLLVRVEQLMAPLDGGLERALAGHPFAAAADQAVMLFEISRDPLGGELTTPRRRDLDRQWYPIETTADLDTGFYPFVGDRDLWRRSASALPEQRQRVEALVVRDPDRIVRLG
ncbi:MAG: hypothetical protein ABIQ73_10585 [Acidimicrobiales bacterium]